MSEQDSNEQDTKGWLLGIHMVAETPDLVGPARADIEEIKRALREEVDGARPVSVCIQLQLPTGTAKRYTNDADPSCLVVEDVGNVKVDEFFREVFLSRRHDRHTIFVLWGHSAGVARGLEHPFYDRRLADFDPSTAKETLGTVDIIGFDSCFMSGLEVASFVDTSNIARFMVASQSMTPLTGWHYELLVAQMRSHFCPPAPPACCPPAPPACTNSEHQHPPVPQEEPEEREQPDPVWSIGRALVAQSGLGDDSPRAVSFIGINPKGDKPFQNVRAAVKALACALGTALLDITHRGKILDCFFAATHGNARQFVDAVSLFQHLAASARDPNVRDKARAVLNSLSGVILDHHTAAIGAQGGISICCPWPRATRSEIEWGVRDALVIQEDLVALGLGPEWTKLLYREDLVEYARRRAAARDLADRRREVAPNAPPPGAPAPHYTPGRKEEPPGPPKYGERPLA